MSSHEIKRADADISRHPAPTPPLPPTPGPYPTLIPSPLTTRKKEEKEKVELVEESIIDTAEA